MIEVIHPGLYSTIQDAGRTGFQRFGVPVGGAMDSVALELANLLVGNDSTEGVLELTLSGTQLLFHESVTVAITGAHMTPMVDGKEIQMGKAITIPKNSTLRFQRPLKGCRTYLAVAGGFQAERVMNSVSTYVRASLGGVEGRLLKKGDQLLLKQPRCQTTDWLIRTDDWWNRPVVRVMKGPEAHQFSPQHISEFVSKPFRVSPQSDRMGFRLEGMSLIRDQQKELLSEPVTFGTIQVPSDGQPILLMADRQTTGGYPRIAQVIKADLSVVAQKKPGDEIQFQWVTREQALAALASQNQALKEIYYSITARRESNAQ